MSVYWTKIDCASGSCMVLFFMTSNLSSINNGSLLTERKSLVLLFTSSPLVFCSDMAYNKGIHSSNNGGNGGRRYALMLLLALGAALLAVTALHILRERRFYNLLVKRQRSSAPFSSPS